MLFRIEWQRCWYCMRRKSLCENKNDNGEKALVKKNGEKEDTIEEIFGYYGMNILDKHFPLYGYASDETYALPKVHFWQGEADAIGWYKDPNMGIERHLIVNWKVVDILNS